jgi:hypothetical protein
MAGAPTNHLNKPYANMYSATDPRFSFPTAPANGSILYYSTVYNKWTGSNATNLKWDAATNILEATNVKSSKFIVNLFEFFTDLVGTTLNLTYDDVTIVTISSTGNITAPNFTGLASRSTRITMSVQPTSTTYFPTFVSSSGASLSALLYTNAQISFTTGASTGTLTCANFSGHLTGSATLVDNTLQTTGTQFLTMMPLSATTSAGQVVGTHGGLSYTVNQNQLNIGNQVGAALRIPLCMLNNTLANGQFNSMQIGYSDTTNNSWYVGARYNTTATDSIFAIVPYGTAGAGGFQIKTDGTVIAPTFQGSLTGSATLIDTTLQTTGTQFLTMVPLSATTSTGQVAGTHAGLNYNVATGTLSSSIFSGSLTGSATLIDTTLIGAFGVMYIPLVVNSATSPSGQTVYTNTVLNFNTTNNTLTATNIVAGSFTGSLTGSASLIDTTAVGTNAVYYIPFVPIGASSQPNGQVLGTDAGLTYNPGNNNTFEVVNGTIKTVSGIISGGLFMLDLATPANYFNIYHNNGILEFNNEWSPLAIPLTINGNGGGVTAYNISAHAYEPAAVELDSPAITDINDQGVLFQANTTNDYSAFAEQTGTTWTFQVSSYNPNSRELTFSVPVSSTQELALTPGGAGAQTITATFGAVTATRNGSAFTAFNSVTSNPSGSVFSWTSSAVLNTYFIRQPITQYTIKFIPQDSGTLDTYVFTFPITLTYANSAGFTWQNTTLLRNTTNYAYGFNRIAGSGTINLVPTAPAGSSTVISAMSLTKDLAQTSTRTLVCDYLQAEFINLVGDYTLSGTSGTLIRCFRGEYDHYELTLRFTSAPTQGTRFTVQPATAAGVASATGYLGSISSAGAVLTFANYGVTTGAILFSVAGTQGVIYTAKIYSPNISRTTTFQAMNIGSDATNVNVPFFSTGYHTVTTAYPSLVWTTTNSINANLTIRGFS